MRYATMTVDNLRQVRIDLLHDLETRHARACCEAEPFPEGHPQWVRLDQLANDLLAQINHHTAALMPPQMLDGGQGEPADPSAAEDNPADAAPGDLPGTAPSDGQDVDD